MIQTLAGQKDMKHRAPRTDGYDSAAVDRRVKDFGREDRAKFHKLAEWLWKGRDFDDFRIVMALIEHAINARVINHFAYFAADSERRRDLIAKAREYLNATDKRLNREALAV
jgi:hypothetical protein